VRLDSGGHKKSDLHAYQPWLSRSTVTSRMVGWWEKTAIQIMDNHIGHLQ
jgi:hypothetical protein